MAVRVDSVLTCAPRGILETCERGGLDWWGSCRVSILLADSTSGRGILRVRGVDDGEQRHSLRILKSSKQGVHMSKFLGLIQAVLLTSVSAVAAGQAPPEAPAKPAPRPLYTYREEMVPMRDGVHLQTVIMVPLDARGPLPILLRRTPYGVPEKAFTEVPESLTALAADGYILVVQNIRGRFKSEGIFSLLGGTLD